MKITVIATGFDLAAAAAEPATPRTYTAPVPTGPPTTSPTGGGPSGPLRRDDLDVPAFIRKKAD